MIPIMNEIDGDGEWSGEVRKRPEEGTTSEGTSELRLRNSPVATPNAMPLTSARHSAVFSVWMVEELAGERDNGLCGVPSCDPSAFGAGGRVVDDGTAAVGRGCGCPGALLGELLCLAICVPWEWVGLSI